MQVANEIAVGQRIAYSGDMANISGRGVVAAVQRNENAPRMFTFAGGMQEVDGRTTLDVVLTDGRLIRQVQSFGIGERPGQRFQLIEGVAGADEIAGLLANAATVRAQAQAAATEKAAALAAAKEAARVAGVARGLIPEADFRAAGRRGSAAAFNLRAELKAAGLKASVVQRDFNCINVSGAGEALAQVEAIANKYQAGNFDGMTDCYDYAPSAWGSVFGDVRYVFCGR